MSGFRVGIIGAGYVSAHHLRALKSLPTVQVVGIADLDQTKAEAVAKKFEIPSVYASAQDLLASGVDVVHVLTPPAHHSKIAIQALQAGVHVLVEKPMAETVEQCEDMIAAAASSQRTLGVVHSARLDPIVLRGVEVAQSGTIGQVLSLDFHRASDYPPWAGGATLPPHYRKGSYPFQDLGVHGLAITEAFLGPIKSTEIDFRSTGADVNFLFDEWTARVECEHGPARLYISWNVRPVRSQIIVHGTKGVMQIDCLLQTCQVTKLLPGPKFASPVICTLTNAARNLYEVPRNVLRFLTGRLPGAPGIHNNILAFYSALESGAPVPVSAGEGLRLVKAMMPACINADRRRDAQRLETLAPRPPADFLVTGAGGFLGTNLLTRLAQGGGRVRAAVRRRPDNPIPNVDYVPGDLGDPEYADTLVANVGVVFHVAAAMKGSATDFQRGTVVATQNLIEASLKHRVRRVVYVSSLSVLEHARPRKEQVTESWPLEPHASRRGAYTQTKLEAEKLMLLAAQDKGLPVCVIRPGVIFGPGMKLSAPAGSFGMFGRWVVVGRGSLSLPLVYVDDVVDAMLLGATRPGVEGALVNLVDPSSITQREYIRRVRSIDNSVKVLYVPQPVLMAAGLMVELLAGMIKRSGPLSRYRIRSIRPLGNFDLGVACERLGWNPRIGLEEGLRRTFVPKATEPC